jgi:membrane protein
MKTIKITVQKIGKKLVRWCESTVQCVLITVELFNKNGLANHAAAGAYGFLFSAAPALLIVALFISQVLKSAPETAAALVGQMGLLSYAFDMRRLSESILSLSEPGIAGFISVIGLLWAARIFALSLQRGLSVIFIDTGAINPAKKVTSSVLIEAAIILFAFMAVSTSVVSLLAPLLMAGLLVFVGYTFVPAKAPKRSAALIGTLCCIGFFSAFFLLQQFIFNAEHYYFIYGTMASLLILLVNVYIFFVLFYLGAELTFIMDSLDALLLSRFIQAGSESEKKRFGIQWFASVNGALRKYIRSYEKGAVLFSRGEQSQEVYYVLSGDAAVYLDEGVMLALIGQGKLLGEMGYFLSESRSATVKAHTDLKALVIPSPLFQEVLRFSHDADKKVITILSERLKKANEKLFV